jgi:protein phosphatase
MLICSDGLSGELTDQFLAAALLTIADPQEAADHLVARAVEAGGRDNATALVIDVVSVGATHGAGESDVTEPGEVDEHTSDSPPEAHPPEERTPEEHPAEEHTLGATAAVAGGPDD